MSEVAIGFPYRLQLDQVSALCVRRDGDGAEELVAVGDEDFAVLTAALDGGRLTAQETANVGDALDDPPGKSDWEAVATDATGRVFAIAESSADVIVLSRSLQRQLHRIVLKPEEGPDRRARKLLEGDNRGPEGFLLRAGGHLLVVKQRKPILLIEFGPRQDRVRGLGAAARLGPESEFELSPGDETELFPLHSWELSDEEAVGSANDLAIDTGGRLYAISSRTHCIYEIAAADRRHDRRRSDVVAPRGRARRRGSQRRRARVRRSRSPDRRARREGHGRQHVRARTPGAAVIDVPAPRAPGCLT